MLRKLPQTDGLGKGKGAKLSFSSEGKNRERGEEASGLQDRAGSYFPHLHTAGRLRSPGAHSGSPSPSLEPVWVLGGASSLSREAGLWCTARAWGQERP